MIRASSPRSLSWCSLRLFKGVERGLLGRVLGRRERLERAAANSSIASLGVYVYYEWTFFYQLGSSSIVESGYG